MPTHKLANEFIRKYNKDLQIKGYSGLRINLKLKMIEEKLKSIKMANVNSLKNEWTGITKSYDTKIKSNEEKRSKEKKKKVNPLVKEGYVKDEKEAKLREKQFREEIKKSKEKKEKTKKVDSSVIDDIKLYVKKYNHDEIKKQNLTKENLKNFVNPAFDLLEKIQKKLDKIDDSMGFIQKNAANLLKKYNDTNKNFVRRVKAQVKSKKIKGLTEEQKKNKIGWNKFSKLVEDNKKILMTDKRGRGQPFRDSYDFFTGAVDITSGKSNMNDKYKNFIPILEKRIKSIKEKQKELYN